MVDVRHTLSLHSSAVCNEHRSGSSVTRHRQRVIAGTGGTDGAGARNRGPARRDALRPGEPGFLERESYVRVCRYQPYHRP
ncbi:protein of unknown function [Streptomyces murinus]